MFDDLGELRSVLASAPPSTALFEQIADHMEYFQPPDARELQQIDYLSSIISRWPSHIERPVPEMALIAHSIGEQDQAPSPFLALCNTLRLERVATGDEEHAAALCQHPLLSSIERVTLHDPYPSTELVQHIIAALPYSVRYMDLSYTHASELLVCLLDSPHMERLEVLILEHAHLVKGAIERWTARAEQVAHGERTGSALRRLSLQQLQFFHINTLDRWVISQVERFTKVIS